MKANENKIDLFAPYINHGERKDQQGRNTLTHLKPYRGYFYMLDKGYLNCNIMERICIRSSYCGMCYPTAMINEIIEFERNLELEQLQNRMYKASFVK